MGGLQSVKASYTIVLPSSQWKRWSVMVLSYTDPLAEHRYHFSTNWEKDEV